MKKIILWLVILFLVASLSAMLTFTGCKAADGEEKADEVTQEEETKAEETTTEEEPEEEEESAEEVSGPARRDKSVLNIGVNTTIQTLDPALSGGRDPLCIWQEIAYDALIYRLPDGTYGPALAESWEYVDEENKVFELTLRSGAKFSDGEDLDAEALKKFWEYYGDAGGPFAQRVKNMESIEVTGPLSLRITFTNSNPN